MKQSSYTTILGAVTFILLLLIIPRFIDWGLIRTAPERTITVNGTAKTQIANQVAQFSAGVTAVNENKDRAVETVNTKMEELIARVKEFGIAQADIQTSNMSIYQDEEPVTIGGRERLQPGQWRVSNSITVMLRDIARATELADLLSASGATNVYGPNFMVDTIAEEEGKLLAEALDDARKKAESLAAASDKKIGAVVTIHEGVAADQMLLRAEGFGGGGGVPLEPGAQTISKTVTVTFELK